METSLTTQKLDFLDELDSLRQIAKKIGEDNPFYQELVDSIEYLDKFVYVFVYAEYVDDCAEKTPKCIRNTISKIYKHKSVDSIRL